MPQPIKPTRVSLKQPNGWGFFRSHSHPEFEIRRTYSGNQPSYTLYRDGYCIDTGTFTAMRKSAQRVNHEERRQHHSYPTGGTNV